jgi:hypothetical protein
MTQDLHNMTSAELKRYISAHRNEDQAFLSALEILMSRRDPNTPYQPYPFDLTDPEGEIKAIFNEKLRKPQ